MELTKENFLSHFDTFESFYIASALVILTYFGQEK